MSDLLYELNARDEISSVNEEWLRFALANGGEPLDSAQILGRLLWDFIGGEETQQFTVGCTGACGRVARRCGSVFVVTRLTGADSWISRSPRGPSAG